MSKRRASFGVGLFNQILAAMLTRYRLVCLLLLPMLLAAHAPPTTGTAVLSGTVRDASGELLIGAVVQVEDTDIGTSADIEGRYRIDGLEADDYRVRFSYIGYESKTIEVTLVDGERQTLDVTLGESGMDLEEVVVSEEASGSRGRTTSSATMSEMSSDSDSAPSLPPPPAVAPASGGAETAPSSLTKRSPHQQGRAGVLTAGDVDDGLNWDAYQRYLSRAECDGGQRRCLATPDLDLDRRITLRVVDREGQPVAGARVRLEADRGSNAKTLTTEAGTDGRLSIFPDYDFGTDARRLTISAHLPGGGGDVSRALDLRRGGQDHTLKLELRAERAPQTRSLDLAIVIDVTGSMSDELNYLTREFESIVARVEDRYPGVDLRFGLVAYRDKGDQFVVRSWGFTRSASDMRDRLASLDANGGGDYPEAMDEALEAALDLDWRTGTTARVAFLVADAPPHPDRTARTMTAVREARARGLRLYPVAASGVADEAEYVMRAAAVLTQARHLFLTDDSGVGNAHAEPKIPCYQVTALNGLLARVIAGELEGRRVEPAREEVIREVGDYDAGVCETPVVAQRPTPRAQNQELGYGN